MNIFFLVLCSFSLFAQEAPVCPPESFVVEFISPTTRAKKVFCAYQKNGETIKHGEELIFDANGSVKQRINHNHGVEGEMAVVATPVFSGHKIPGTEEATSNFTDKLIGSKPANEEIKILSTIKDLIIILTLKKEDIGKGRFLVGKCDDKPADWVKGAIFNTPIKKSYIFKDHCDVNGSFNANFNNAFPVNFALRNLDDFNKTEMTVKMKVTKSTTGIRYGFEVVEGFISSATRNANFKVEYEVDINPMTGEADKNSQSGKVTLTKIGGKEVQASAALKYEE